MKGIDTVQETNRVVLSVAKTYGRNWTTKKGLVEVMSNAIDAVKRLKANFDFSWADGKAYIRDTGNGLKLSDFAFGGYRDKDEEDIGTFGEGGKMAALSAARENREFIIHTVNFSARFRFENEKAFGNTEVLVLYTWPSNKEIGTEVIVECSEEEFNYAKEHFIEYSGLSKLDKKIYKSTAPGENYIFVVGQRTCSSDSMMSYNFINKEMMNCFSQPKMSNC